jgi:hypothetical protein
VGNGGILILEPGANLITVPGSLLSEGGNIFTRLPPPPPAGPAPHPIGLRAAGNSSAMRAQAAGNDVATIQGSVSMTHSGTITVEIDPENATSTQPALRVTGDVNLGGKLTIQFTHAFAPVVGQKFKLFDFQSKVAGQFAQIEVTGLAPGFQYDLKPDSAGLYTLSALNDGAAISPPYLSIARTAAQLTISWAATAKGYVLQSAGSVGTPNWQTVPTTSPQYTVPLPQSDLFFRLTKP